jgi:hypothetical protein
MTKLRTFLAGLLLVPVLTLNASPFPTEADEPSLETTHPVTGTCWVYYLGRWIQIPC